MRFFGNPDRNAQQAVLNGAIGDGGLATDGEKEGNTAPNEGIDSGSFDERPSEDVQAGVKKVEAVTLTWTKKELYFAYFWCVVHLILCSREAIRSTNRTIVSSSFSFSSLYNNRPSSGFRTM